LPTDKLPATGRALRRTYRTVAADLGVNEVLTRLLMGHSLAGINQRYITELVLQSGPGLRTAQAAISRRIVTLLGQP
jgi:integrase